MARKQGSHSDITGPKVRAAALGLIAQHGFAAVSMRQIAAEVGVQAGALYNYTPDKQTLLFDLMRRHMEKLLAALAQTALAGPATGQLEAFTRFHIAYHLPRRDAVFVSYMELRNLSPANFATIEVLRRQGRGRAGLSFVAIIDASDPVVQGVIVDHSDPRVGTCNDPKVLQDAKLFIHRLARTSNGVRQIALAACKKRLPACKLA